jgi:DNA-directed RNA polymerase specialized sigma24 family protein
MIEIQEAKKRKPKGVQYFTQDTENAINEYNSTTDFELKDKIYRERIHYAFFKLTENIIHTFKFYYTEVDNIQDLQHEVITFLLTKLHLFNPEKGAKAYSYFGTIAKRYLINSNNKNYKKRVEKAPVSEIESNENFSYRIDEGSESDKLINFIDQYVEHCTEHIN